MAIDFYYAAAVGAAAAAAADVCKMLILWL